MQIKERINYICSIASSPRAYAWYSYIGLATTMVLTIIATREECKREAAKSSEEKSEKTTLDEVKEIATNYIPPIISAGVTAYCINKSVVKGEERLQLANQMTMFAQNTASLYRSQAPGIVTASLINGFSKRPPDEDKEWFCLKDMVPSGDIYFQSTQLNVLSAMYKLNKLFADKNAVSVKDFARFLGPDVEKQLGTNGNHYGWNIEVYYEWGDFPWIDFSCYNTTDQETGIVINMIAPIWGPQYVEDEKLFTYGYSDYPTE